MARMEIADKLMKSTIGFLAPLSWRAEIHPFEVVFIGLVGFSFIVIVYTKSPAPLSVDHRTGYSCQSTVANMRPRQKEP